MKFYDLGPDSGWVRLDAITSIPPVLEAHKGYYFIANMSNGWSCNSQLFKTKAEADHARQELLDVLEAE